MIRHIVMFKLKEFATPADKQAKMQEIKTGLEALIDKIDVLLRSAYDFNVNRQRHGIHLTTELDTLEDVGTYANHPEHVAVPRASSVPSRQTELASIMNINKRRVS